jgi:hypothetical protein
MHYLACAISLLGVAHATYEMECTDDARLWAREAPGGVSDLRNLEGRAALGPANEVRSERWGFPRRGKLILQLRPGRPSPKRPQAEG